MSRKLFSETVRRLREKRLKDDDRFTQRKFARTVGVSSTYLCQIEKGDFPPPTEERIIAIAKALGEDPDKLLALAGKVDPDLIRIILKRPLVMPGLIRKIGRMNEKALEKIHLAIERESRRKD